MNNGDRYLLCGKVITYQEPEMLNSVQLNAKTKKIIKIGDEVILSISEKQVYGIVEEIHKAIVESLIKVRLTPTQYILINTIHIEYRGYGKHGFYSL